MTAHQIANLLLACPDVEVFTCPNVAQVWAVEEARPSEEWMETYVVIHSGCKAIPSEFGVFHD